MIHPIVRDLYKRVLMVSKDYPSTDHQHIKQLWKTAIRNPENCPSWYTETNCNPISTITPGTTPNSDTTPTNDINELYHAVHRGRLMVKEMIGIVQLHKYRSMKQRYNSNDYNSDDLMTTSIAKIAAATEPLTKYTPTNDNTATTMATSKTPQKVVTES
jgi:hypothetical protein